MNEELELGLDIPVLSMEQKLGNAIRNGKRFFSIKETARILGTSGFKVYNLVYHYRLDAFLIGGEYRIPWNAIDILAQELPAIRRQFFSYIDFTESRQIPRFFKLRELVSGGGTIDEARKLLSGLSVSDEMIDRMVHRALPDIDLPRTEDSPQDWYDIPAIGFPDKAPCSAWAESIGTTCDALGAPWRRMIDYPAMFDFLVEHEVVNLPVPYRVEPVRKTQQKDGQQWLF